MVILFLIIQKEKQGEKNKIIKNGMLIVALMQVPCTYNTTPLC
jgi:hypothetical protein